jgi:hypothetical protein
MQKRLEQGIVRSGLQRSYGGIGTQKMTQRMGINVGTAGQQVKVRSQGLGQVQMMKGLSQAQTLVMRSSQMCRGYGTGSPSKRRKWRRMRRKHLNVVKQSGRGACLCQWRNHHQGFRDAFRRAVLLPSELHCHRLLQQQREAEAAAQQAKAEEEEEEEVRV